MHYEKFADGSLKCIEDEIPFELPEGWEWARLGILAQYKKGPFGSSITKAMFVPDSPDAVKVYEQKNAINKDATLGSYFISTEKYESLKSFEVFPNDIIVSCAGTIGETFVLPIGMRKGIINQALMKISLFDLETMDFYLMYFDFKLKSAAQEQGHGIALKNIPPFDVLKKYLVPIPPIQEQHRIVVAVNNMISKVDFINADSAAIQDLISQAKSKILDLAIRGKLVPQDPNDEPASVLLERIRAEKEELIKQGKIKRDKKESVIFKGDDNSYYHDIPDNWAVCRLKEIFNVCSAKRVRQSEWKSSGVPFYRAREIVKLSDNGCVDNELFISEEHYLKVKAEFGVPKSGDLMVSGVGTIGKVYIVKENDRFYYKDASVLCFENRMGAIDSQFARYMLESTVMQSQMKENSKGTTVDTITISAAMDYICVLPPLTEQKRIVTTIEQYFSLLNKISEALT